MKIGFFGTPEIASYCLESISQKHDVLFVVTGEDKPSGRNRKIVFSPVKQAAIEKDIPVLQPSSLKDDNFINQLREYDVEIYVVVAYGKLIPASVFDMPRYKTINLHPSMLPLYRGAAPMQWALINGESETGVTVQMINEKMDAGDIVVQRKLELTKDMNLDELYSKVLPLAAELLFEALEQIEKKEVILISQKHEDATFCKKIDKEIARIDWNRSAKDIHNLVRGLNPAPVAWTTFRDKNVKVWKTSLFTEEDIELAPAQIIRYKKKRLLAGTGDGCLELISLQPEAKKIMDSLAFINGYRLTDQDIFE